MDRKLNREPVLFDGFGRVLVGEKNVHFLLLSGKREPQGGHRETKFTAVRFGSFLSRHSFAL